MYLLEADLSLKEYGIIGIVLCVVFAMLQKQVHFSNKLALDHDKKKEDDLDKISAALIIIREGQAQQTHMCEQIVESVRMISQNQGFLAQDMNTIKDIVIQKLPDVKQF